MIRFSGAREQEKSVHQVVKATMHCIIDARVAGDGQQKSNQISESISPSHGKVKTMNRI